VSILSQSLGTHVVYSIQGSGVFGQGHISFGGISNENDIFVMQHRVGCRVCGTRRSSRFRAWGSYSHLEGFEGVGFTAPKSDVICEKCHRAATRGTLKVRTTSHLFTYSSPFVFPL
jgi:hypothetical protein